MKQMLPLFSSYRWTHDYGWWYAANKRNDGNVGIQISTVHISLQKMKQFLSNNPKKRTLIGFLLYEQVAV